MEATSYWPQSCHQNTIVGCLVTFEGYFRPCEKDSRTLFLRFPFPFKYFAEHV